MPSGVYKRTETHKENIRKANKGNRLSIKTKERMSKAKTREKNPHWQGGKIKNPDGYVYILMREHPFANNEGYVPQHRLVVEQQIGRYLKPQEECHHLNRIRDDNHPGNLMAFINRSIHQKFHYHSEKVKPEEIIFDGRKLKHPA